MYGIIITWVRYYMGKALHVQGICYMVDTETKGFTIYKSPKVSGGTARVLATRGLRACIDGGSCWSKHSLKELTHNIIIASNSGQC